MTDVLVVRPERPANGGEAVGRVDGRVVFVRGAIPGELVRVRVTGDRHSGFLRADVVEILEPSPHRVESICDAAGHGAGCCDLAFIEPAYARELKGRIVVDALSRIGRFSADDITAAGVDADTVVDPLGGEATGWRVRTRLGVDAHGRAGMRAFHDARIVVGHECAAPVPGMLDGLDAGSFTPGADLAVVADMDGHRHITELAPPAVSRPRHGRDRRGRAQSARRHRDAPRPERVVEGGETAAHRVGERVWDIPVTGFWQAHRAAPEVYANTVVDLLTRADPPGADRGLVAWDLYGGAGVFAAGVLDHRTGGSVRSVHVVESDAGAVAAAEQTLGDDDRVHTHRAEVSAAVADLPTPDVVILDPPRTGAGASVVGAIADADPAVIVHVGCDVGRFARDLALFTEHGYQVREIRAFDAFPATHHVEAIACLVPVNRQAPPQGR
ncbi:TRAM domain-containing protein [Gordonia sp. CPCC 206044]|uniref:class I SAM-dependent RNA methyltransferase n=1 Tax=Gordonia sp. CPCC 206044 TaxID=3140793 RepID=UPI003AF37DDD